MTMLELIDSLVEILRDCELEGVGTFAVEKYRRPGPAQGLVICVTPVSQAEKPVAIGGQFAEEFKVEIRCEVPWTAPSATLADAMLRAVDRVLGVLESHREIGNARRGAIGEVTYEISQRPGGPHVMVARIPVSYAASKSGQ